ncbi:lipoprotein, partial [Streptomyces sp. MMG1121]
MSCLALAGCSSSGAHSDGGGAGKNGASATGPSGSAGAAGSVGTIPVGAGPQTTYTVQQQPPAGSCHYRMEKGEPLEDLRCNPGAVSPAVTQANLASTICRKGGYTKDIRPPEAVTGKEKRLNAASYGYKGRLGDAEYDH